jgi:hypothetical protein
MSSAQRSPFRAPPYTMSHLCCVPLGMSLTDFHSLIRKRCFDDLAHQLIKQGRVCLPGSTHAARRIPQPLDPEHDPANTPESPVTAVGAIVLPPYTASSLYSRDMDNSPLWSSSPVHTTFSGHTDCEDPSSTPMTMPSSVDSSRSCSPSDPQAISSSVTSGSIHEPHWDAAAASAKPKNGSAGGLFSLVKKGLRLSNMTRRTSGDSTSSNGRTTNGEKAPYHIKGSKRAHGPIATHTAATPIKGLRNALVALLDRHKHIREQHESRPCIDRIVELGHLRRRIRELDFGDDDKIMLAFDLSNTLKITPLRFLEGPPDFEAIEADLAMRTPFRERLARIVLRRIAFLELQSEVASVITIEHWYSDVVALIGWRDDEEYQLSWRTRRNHGFF